MLWLENVEAQLRKDTNLPTVLNIYFHSTYDDVKCRRFSEHLSFYTGKNKRNRMVNSLLSLEWGVGESSSSHILFLSYFSVIFCNNILLFSLIHKKM